ncbi:MAG TPA: hypothetical protein VH643_07855 [Gemmataceae bacterium]|jgi:hypothetical protein
MFRARWSVVSGLVFLFTPAPLLAQWSSSNKHALLYSGYNPDYYASSGVGLPPAARGYQVTKMIEQGFLTTKRVAVSSVPVPRYVPAPEPVPSALAVDINPPPSQPMTVAIRGPDGKVRNFPLASPDAIQPRTIIVRPGERLSVTLRGTVRVQIQRK